MKVQVLIDYDEYNYLVNCKDTMEKIDEKTPTFLIRTVAQYGDYTKYLFVGEIGEFEKKLNSFNKEEELSGQERLYVYKYHKWKNDFKKLESNIIFKYFFKNKFYCDGE